LKPNADFPYALTVPRSHICPSCLTELARIRAVPDPHYGLAVVVCPECSLACVRTKHPDRAFWRGVGRRVRSIRLFIITIISTALSVGALIGMSLWMVPVLTDFRAKYIPIGMIDLDRIDHLVAALMLVLLSGSVIRTIYAHQRLWVAWLILMIPGFVFISIDYTVLWTMNRLSRMLERIPDQYPPTLNEIHRRYEVLLIMAGVASIGMLLGIILNRMIVAGSHKRVSKIRRKLNKRQARQY